MDLVKVPAPENITLKQTQYQKEEETEESKPIQIFSDEIVKQVFNIDEDFSDVRLIKSDNISQTMAAVDFKAFAEPKHALIEVEVEA